jgi:cell wall assembly regulator SMI1
MERWHTLRAWWEAGAADGLDALRAPASAEAVDAAQRVMGVELPADYRAWLLAHDGAEHGLFSEEVLSIAGVVSTWRLFGELFADDHDASVEADPGVRPVWWHSKWIPITSDGAGNHLCLDLEPAPGGVAGQLVRFWHDSGERMIEAPNLAAWFDLVHERLVSGEWVVTERDGRFDGVVPRAALTGSLVHVRIRGETEHDHRARIELEKQRKPGWLVVSVVSLLERYGLIELAPGAYLGLVLSNAEEATRGAASPALVAARLHAALTDDREVARVAITVELLGRVLAAYPFVDELLGPRPARVRSTGSAIERELEPLEAMEDALAETGAPPAGWLDRHAPDGTLGAAWQACRRPRLLLALASRSCDRTQLVAAVCAWIRTARTTDELQVEPGALEALAAAEAWTRGECAATAVPATGSLGAHLARAITATTIARASAQAACAIELTASSDEAQARAAELVRSRLPCPALPDLVRAFAAERSSTDA